MGINSSHQYDTPHWNLCPSNSYLFQQRLANHEPEEVGEADRLPLTTLLKDAFHVVIHGGWREKAQRTLADGLADFFLYIPHRHLRPFWVRKERGGEPGGAREGGHVGHAVEHLRFL